jgi:hypothetical protein
LLGVMLNQHAGASAVVYRCCVISHDNMGIVWLAGSVGCWSRS